VSTTGKSQGKPGKVREKKLFLEKSKSQGIVRENERPTSVDIL